MDFSGITGQNVVIYPCHGQRGNQEWKYLEVSLAALLLSVNSAFSTFTATTTTATTTTTTTTYNNNNNNNKTIILFLHHLWKIVKVN